MKMKAATRNALPSSDFGLPKQRKYPMQDRGHQIAAKGRAHEEEKKGVISPSTASKIIAKANRRMGGK